ncbi:hypothetical protein I316_06959 [Kwoniella heveanensis BCC8398]|uniref:DH domain-containing protein n=1 Tax=Kwoniella heveanensis BCC8398 TaxID=1296120 RepID=A0A1B9GJX0_9TREE|nr:hypothetical protein I316_06959 [Kwoniella heveanensis BCC8398]
MMIASPHRSPGRGLRQRSAEPLSSSNPIDLNSSTRSTDKDTGNKVTRRAFLIDVVVENAGEETANLLSHFGDPVRPLTTLPAPPVTTSQPSSSRSSDSDSQKDLEDASECAGQWTGPKKLEMATRLNNLIEELVRTERSYFSRIHALKTNYADRLRLFARDPNQQLIPPYEAKAMFANIEVIVPASAAFLTELDSMLQSGQAENSVGDMCLRHFKDLRTFDPYRTYLGKQDESQRLFQESLKRYPGFSSFIDSTKYQTTGIGNIGLRELLMEPVQRIPRYTLLWQTMIKCMSPMSTQKAKLLECIEIASRIARCEPDAQTVRATVMYHLERNIDDFPAKLFSNSREFIDAIDVEDLPSDSRPLSISSNSTPSMASFGSITAASQLTHSPPLHSAAMTPLHCTLFLFDDKLVIVKRQSTSISGRKVTGTDDVQRLVRNGGGVAALDRSGGGGRKDKLSFKGEVDVLDIIASDVGNGDFHLFLERPPMDQSGRWSARPFRSYTTVQPPFSVALDPVATQRDKLRFIHNLWNAQALARAKLATKDVRTVPRVLAMNSEVELDSAGEAFGRAKCFWDIWDRSGWNDQRKGKVVVLVDETGIADPLPLQDRGPPLLSIRLQPMSGSLCRFSYSTIEVQDEDRMVIDMSEVPEKIALTVHRYGIFKFRTGTTSCPTTPSAASHRLRPSMLNLDAISRNLFGGSVTGRGTHPDALSVSANKRASRSEMNRTPTLHEESHREPARQTLSRQSSSPSDGLIAGAPYKSLYNDIGQSEVDLNERLLLARKNSKPAASLLISAATEPPDSDDNENRDLEQAEASLRATPPAEAAPPSASITAPLRLVKIPSPGKALSPPLVSSPLVSPPTDVTPRATPLNIRSTPTLGHALPANGQSLFTSPRSIASPSLPMSSAAPLSPRPLPNGPRSPLPGSRIPIQQQQQQQPAAIGSAHTKLRIVSGGGRRISVGREMVPLKGEGGGGGDENESPLSLAKSTPPPHISTKRQHSTDNLTPRKRSPSRSPLHPSEGAASPLHPTINGRKPSLTHKVPGSRRTSGGKPGSRRSSGPLTTPRTVSASQTSVNSVATSTATVIDVDVKQYPDLSAAIEGSHHKIHDALGSTKRLKSELSGLRKQISKEVKGKDLAQRLERNASLPRSPQRRNINRIADIDRYELVTSSRHATSGKHEIDAIVMDECARGAASIVDRVEGNLRQASSGCEQAALLATQLTSVNDRQSQEILSLQGQLQRSRESHDLAQRQLHDAQIELDVIYEAFNTELDGMFDDAQLPETDAFRALQADLKTTKGQRNQLELENKKLRRELEEANLKRDQ